MTDDTSKWPEQARRLLAWINARRLTPEQDYPGGYDGVGPRRDLEALVARLCPDPEAHRCRWTDDRHFEHTPKCAESVKATGRWLCGEPGPEPRGEPARQPCDEGAPGSTPSPLRSTQALDSAIEEWKRVKKHRHNRSWDWWTFANALERAGDALVSAVSSALPDSRVQEQPPTGPQHEPQEPDEPEWATRLRNSQRWSVRDELVDEALRERAELLRALDTITERASRLDRERDEARAEVDRLRAELASVRADFFASQRG